MNDPRTAFDLTDEREAKLPAWARRLLERVRMASARSRVELDRIRDNPPSDTCLNYYSTDGPTVYLRDGERVYFAGTEERTWICCRVLEDGTLEVSASASISVSPSASNQVYIKHGGHYA